MKSKHCHLNSGHNVNTESSRGLETATIEVRSRLQHVLQEAVDLTQGDSFFDSHLQPGQAEVSLKGALSEVDALPTKATKHNLH